ncbi:hypothetical protein NVP1148O_38 [Vibrio phage 1.148.O._10N.286.54.A10]|nr:hypothetical protein NVP1148O_38 [Vibrio phage 1.148.O._10N.286.54.A10]
MIPTFEELMGMPITEQCNIVREMANDDVMHAIESSGLNKKNWIASDDGKRMLSEWSNFQREMLIEHSVCVDDLEVSDGN